MAVLTLAEALPRLRAQHQESRLVPFLGAGFSIPLKLPSWRALVGWMAITLGFEHDLFELHGTAPQVAEYFTQMDHTNLQKLVHEMTAKFNTPEVNARRAASITHQALARCNFRIIYTTNYDSHIELALRDAGKPAIPLTSLEDFQNAHPGGACAVIKFHGTLEQPDSIVLTESAYFDRLRMEAATDQRLRADLLTSSFLFIGYGFSDMNIRNIWYRMNRMRKQTGHGVPVRRSYFATFRADPVQPQLLDSWNIDWVLLDPLNKDASVAQLLNGLI